MDRREFIKRTVPVSTIPFLLGGFSLRAYGRSPLLEALVGSIHETDNVLVLVQLNGGNDGLNTVIPRDQYSALMTARPNITIAENKVVALTDATGLHPALTAFQQLYADGKLAVVQGVGYPNPNFPISVQRISGSPPLIPLRSCRQAGWAGIWIRNIPIIRMDTRVPLPRIR